MKLILFGYNLHCKMEDSRTILKGLVFLTSFVHVSSSVTHSLKFGYTAVTPGIKVTAVGLLDGEQFSYYDSNIRKMIPKTEWIKKITADDKDYWNRETDRVKTHQDSLDTVIKSLNQTEGHHTLQRMVGCEIHDNSTTGGFDQFGYDGEDFISLDLNSATWTTAEPQAKMFIKEWDSKGVQAQSSKNYLKSHCIDQLNKFVNYSRETLKRKDRPTASVFQKQSPSPELVCYVTGFFPKAVMIFWRKDGKDVREDADLRETLPNQDGSFQKKSILKVPAEELQKHTYTCVIQHSSLEKELVLEVPKGGGSMAIIIGAVVALIVLGAVAAGIMVWKKKNSGFIHAPASEESLPPPTKV